MVGHLSHGEVDRGRSQLTGRRRRIRTNAAASGGENNMSAMKRIFNKVQPVLAELNESGPGTRMELFKRTGHENWPQFKRLMSFIMSQELIEIVAIPSTIQTGFALTKEGRLLVQQ
jgi:hypothetical protein